MNDTDAETGKPNKRTDVGYKRPPREHQFKKGQPRPPRKKQEEKKDCSAPRLTRILGEVLNERRRVLINGKVRWISGAELVIRQSYLKAEKGSAMLTRELARLLLSLETAADAQILKVVTDPSAPEDLTGLRRIEIDPDYESR